jgi:hypothetical protein
MTPASATVLSPEPLHVSAIREEVDHEIENLLRILPDAATLTADQRRGIIARYAAVLEGNFIYWMTGALLAAKSATAKEKIVENLHEEVRDSHPNMMRKFAIAASAVPTDADAAAVFNKLTGIRLFIGRLAPVPIVITMTFFEGFIQRFMPYLADLAKRQGSLEMEYTDVHGVCDIKHTEELYNALAAEIALSNGSRPSCTELFEGVRLLRDLIETIVVG